MSRRLSLVAACGGVVVVVGVAVSVVLAGHSGPAHQAAARPSTAPAVVVHTEAEAGEAKNVAMVTALVAQLPAELAQGRTGSLTAAAVQLYPQVRTALPAGATVRPVPGSWRRTGVVGSILVDVTAAPGATPARFRVVVIHEGDTWKVSSTFPADAP